MESLRCCTKRKIAMKFIALEHHPNDSRIKIAEDGICQSLTSRMGTGGNNVPLVLCFSKQRRAQSKDDFETWVESDMANTLNAFDLGDIRATTIVINETADSVGVKSESRNDNG